MAVRRARWAVRRRIERLRDPRAVVFALALAAALLLVVADAWARPGGGHGYSGGSRGGGSHGGGGGSDGGDGLFGLFLLLLQLCFEYPAIGIPLLLIFLAVVVGTGVVRAVRSGYHDWESGVSTTTSPQPSPQRAWGEASQTPWQQRGPQQVARSFPSQTLAGRRALDALRTFDENFSTVLWEDFLYSLFAEVHRSRGGNQLDRLSAYLGSEARMALAQRPAAEVSTIIVGAMRVLSVSGVGPSDSHVHVSVEFEANFTERYPNTQAPQGLYVVEQWHLSRAHGPLSRTPDRARVIGCPSCGAPLDVVIAGYCSYCKQHVNTGAFDWVVQRIDLVRREARGPMLTSDVEEQGTSLPTVVDPAARQALGSLMQKDQQFRWETFQARVGLIFSEFQIAWSSRDLKRMRPFLSDNLFQTQVYWIEAYKAQRLRNITERTRITALELAKVASDKFFDAITVRLYATGLDYTVRDDDNRVVSGSRSKERSYSEYWTLVRGTGRNAPTRTDKVCPNCGAPLQINMAGHCEYCQAKVTSGDFDWVLSRIEQDESYEG
jgi:hypothetical protein